jgi:MoaA/NifB/PqqE/SkfB family radical SAM enzyme
MPFQCNYYVTVRCNQRCVFCNIPHTSNGSASREPTMDQVRANLRDLRRLGVQILDVTGGEPLLYKHLVEMLTLAKEMGFTTSVTTNGMLYPRYAEQLKGLVDALLFSLESTDAEEHDRLRAMKSWHKTTAAIKLARKLKQVPYISHVVTDEAMPNIPKMEALAEELGAILYLNPCFSFFGNPGISTENAKKLEDYYGRKNVIVDLAQLRHVAAGGNDINDPVCQASTSTVVISPHNDLWLPCYHFKQQGIPIENDLYELYHSEQVREVQAMEGRYDFCQGCTVYCYMRGSLAIKYPVESARMLFHYGKERLRRKVEIWTGGVDGEGAPVTGEASVPARVRKSLPVLSADAHAHPHPTALGEMGIGAAQPSFESE